jgi:hypothetical protein
MKKMSSAFLVEDSDVILFRVLFYIKYFYICLQDYKTPFFRMTNEWFL